MKYYASIALVFVPAVAALAALATYGEEHTPEPPGSERVGVSHPDGLTRHEFDDRTLLTTRVTTGDVNLDLPAFFHARVFAVLGPTPRHLAVRDDGVVYVRMRDKLPGLGTLVALQDTDGDGHADIQRRFGGAGGTAVLIEDGYLYYSTVTGVFRRKFASDELVPRGPEEPVLTGIPDQADHNAKALASDGQGHLFTMVGAPSNACMESPRTPGSPGQMPCPQLERQGQVYRFEIRAHQRYDRDAYSYARGLRQLVAMDWHEGALYGVQHGRDQLHFLFPEWFSPKESAELPAEEFLLLEDGFLGGWPYTYFDWRLGVRMLAPEYGGDGLTVS
ncbi:MAG: hypothetical protein AAFY60_20495, partial [Myxococcota bacterium]